MTVDFSIVLLFANNLRSVLIIQDLTGLESMDQCRRTLEQHNWNIEVRAGKPTELILSFFCIRNRMIIIGIVLQAAVQDRLNEQEGVPSVFNPPPARPLQVNTTDHRVYSYIVSRPQPRVRGSFGFYAMCSVFSSFPVLISFNLVFSINIYIWLHDCKALWVYNNTQ